MTVPGRHVPLAGAAVTVLTYVIDGEGTDARNRAASRGLAGGQGVSGGRRVRAPRARGRRPGGAVGHRDRERGGTRRPVGAAGRADPAAGRGDGAGTADDVRDRAAPAGPPAAASPSRAGPHHPGDGPLHRVPLALDRRGTAAAPTGSDQHLRRSARGRGHLVPALRAPAHRGSVDRAVRQGRTAAPAAYGGSPGVHEGRRHPAAQRSPAAAVPAAPAGPDEDVGRGDGKAGTGGPRARTRAAGPGRFRRSG